MTNLYFQSASLVYMLMILILFFSKKRVTNFETKLFAIGDAGKIENAHYETKEILDEEKGLYEKFYILDNILVGAILIGDNSKMMEVLSKINKPIKE